MPESPPEPRPVRSRRRFGLSLRALMAGVLVLGGTMGWIAYEARVQKDAVEAIKATGGSVFYDWETGPDALMIRGPRPSGPWAPGWLVKAVGVDFFGHVAMAEVGAKGTDDDMARVGRLKGLVNLSIRGTAVTDAGMAHVARLSKLRRLMVSDQTATTAASMAPIGRLTNLEYFYFPKPLADADLAHMEGLTRLQILLLQNAKSPRLTDAGLAHLAGLSDLQTLLLDAPSATSAGLVHLGRLSKLKVLGLEGSRVRSLEPLKSLTMLVDLKLARTAVDDSGLAPLATTHRLVILDLSGTKVTDAGLAHLRGQASLTNLDISRTSITDVGLADLPILGEITYLSLNETNITDAGLAKIAGLVKLRMLNLQGTKVTDAGLVHLAKMPLNRWLILSGTAVTDAGIIKYLGGKTTLNHVDLRGTAVGKAGLAALRLNGVKAMTGPVPKTAANRPN